MNNTSKATPREFLQELWQTYLDKDDSVLSAQAQTDYESIVRAVNNFEVLLDLLKDIANVIPSDYGNITLTAENITTIKQAIEQAEKGE